MFIKPKISILTAKNKDVISIKDYIASFMHVSLWQNTESLICLNDKSFLNNIIQIESGFSSMIALTKQGNVYGRGGNECGELGFGDKKARDKWTQIPIPFKVRQISLRCRHTLFLTENGQVHVCGSNALGQLVCII